ncbi:MAG: ATP-binding protein [Chloroflexota bacterium]
MTGASRDSFRWRPSPNLTPWKIWPCLLARGLERRFFLELAQGIWIDQNLNTLVLCPTGSGKSFFSCVLRLAACRTNQSVRYFITSRLLFQLVQSRLDGSFLTLLASLAKIDLLVLDDWMRDPITTSETRDLLEILDDRFGHISTLVASQVPMAEWFTRFPDPTHADPILNPIIQIAYRLNLTGDSQRKCVPPSLCHPLD